MPKKFQFVSTFLILIAFLLFTAGEIQASEIYYLHQDNLGSTALITKDGTVVSKENYYPYGTSRFNFSANSESPTEKGYTGQISDQIQTGLMYYNARYYDPNLARFFQTDIVNEQLNRYSYVYNNPLKYNDPTGNYAELGGTGTSGGTSNGQYDYHQTYEPPYPDCNSYYLFECAYFEKEVSRVPGLEDVLKYLDPELVKALAINILPDSGGNLFTKILNLFTFGEGAVVFQSGDSNVINMHTQTNYEANNPLFSNAGISYELSFLHEARHVWQSKNDTEGAFASQVADMAVDLGLIPENWDKKTTYTKEEYDNLIVRPSLTWVNEKKGEYKATWKSEQEVDALVVEAMLNPDTRNIIKTKYTELWNLIYNQPGYFK